MNWNDYFAHRPYLVLDGALGTCLECKGETLDPFLWSAGHLICNPSSIRGVHLDYLTAGADILTTSSYQISYDGFFQAQSFSAGEVDEFLRLSTDLAKQAIQSIGGKNYPNQTLVAASVGCYGAHLANRSEYYGNYGKSWKEIFEWHLPKVRKLIDTNPDILAFETIPVLDEVKAITRVIGTSPVIPAWISFACKSGTHLNGGESVEDACRIIEDCKYESMTYDGLRNMQQTIIGINCTSLAHILPLIQIIKENCSKNRRIIVYPNNSYYDETTSDFIGNRYDAELFAGEAVKWFHAGATIVGSCCNTDPSFTRAISESLRLYTT